MFRFLVRVHMVCLLGLAALAVTVSPAHGQGRSMRMPQTPTVRQFPRNTPMTAQTFVQPRRFSANQFEGTRFNRFEDRFERRFDRGFFVPLYPGNRPNLPESVLGRPARRRNERPLNESGSVLG